MSIKKHIPNSITCMNLFSGCIAVDCAMRGNLLAAFCFIILSAVFDFFDGFAARRLGVASPIGKDLDSLADMVSFGLAPAAIVSSLLKECQYPDALLDAAFLVPYLAYFIAVFSGLRLARFNNDERQHKSFIGLATPANAIMTASLANIPAASLLWQPWPEFGIVWSGPWGIAVLLAYVALSSYLLVCPLSMFSFKQVGKLQYIFAGIALCLTAVFGFAGIFATMLVYIIMSAASAKSAGKDAKPGPAKASRN